MVRILLEFESGGKFLLVTRTDRTPTVDKLMAALPFSSKANRWGDEVYFDCPFHSEPEQDARQEMVVGDVAYWPEGDAIAVFFGRTPISRDDEPMAYSPCNILGRIEGDSTRLSEVRSGQKVGLREA